MYKLPISGQELEKILNKEIVDVYYGTVDGEYIDVAVDFQVVNGSEIKFISPVDCSEVTKFKVISSYDSYGYDFSFADANGNDLSNIGNLFTQGAIVKVVLDVTNGKAFIQNADTNAYLERCFIGLNDIKTTDSKDEINNFKKTGWIKYFNEDENGNRVNLIDGIYSHAVVIRSEMFNHDYFTQTAIITTGACLRRIHTERAGWGPWEHIRHDMIPGVEYRTVEKFNGETVYTKLIQALPLGIPETGDYEISHGISNLSKVIRVNAFYGDRKMLPWFDYAYDNFSLINMVSSTGIILRNKQATWASSSGVIEIILYYTKG